MVIPESSKIVLVSGGFDPIHSGHISLLNHADHLGDFLIVALNSDDWLARKKGKAFMSWKERMTILGNLHMVDDVIAFDDSDGTALDAIRKVKEKYPNNQIIFANGGDRTSQNIPEMIEKDIIFKFGVGGENKENSSSKILQNWTTPVVQRPWGAWTVLSQLGPEVKTKELIVTPGAKLSMQRHQYREEFWWVAKGKARVHWIHGHTDISKHHTISIQKNEWHQLENTGEEDLHIIEIQFGSLCSEEDIERKLS